MLKMMKWRAWNEMNAKATECDELSDGDEINYARGTVVDSSPQADRFAVRTGPCGLWRVKQLVLTARWCTVDVQLLGFFVWEQNNQSVMKITLFIYCTRWQTAELMEMSFEADSCESNQPSDDGCINSSTCVAMWLFDKLFLNTCCYFIRTHKYNAEGTTN